MEIVFVLFDGITALDAVGPYEVLQRLPGTEVKFAAKAPGEYRTDTKSLALVADHALADVPRPDILVMPGGFGTRPLLDDTELLDWVRAAHEHTTWTTSVCTGSLVYGAAGILDGLEATTHWKELETLRRFGARPTHERVVEQGKIVTAAGVSSGIDMALTLMARIAGDDVAKTIQLAIEYDPQPPFDAGSPEKAPKEIVEFLTGIM
jgi:transcriptional regulator GlxA family with amidase domain